MHALGEHVRDGMDARGWTAAELSRRSGVSKEVISNLLNPARKDMTRPPSRFTIEGIAAAFGGAQTETVLWRKVAESMGLPIGDQIVIADPTLLSDLDLLLELARRMQINADVVTATVGATPR